MTKSAGDNLHYRPLLQILGGRVPPAPVIYAHDLTAPVSRPKAQLHLFIYYY